VLTVEEKDLQQFGLYLMHLKVWSYMNLLTVFCLYCPWAIVSTCKITHVIRSLMIRVSGLKALVFLGQRENPYKLTVTSQNQKLSTT